MVTTGVATVRESGCSPGRFARRRLVVHRSQAVQVELNHLPAPRRVLRVDCRGIRIQGSRHLRGRIHRGRVIRNRRGKHFAQPAGNVHLDHHRVLPGQFPRRLHVYLPGTDVDQPPRQAQVRGRHVEAHAHQVERKRQPCTLRAIADVAQRVAENSHIGPRRHRRALHRARRVGHSRDRRLRVHRHVERNVEVLRARLEGLDALRGTEGDVRGGNAVAVRRPVSARNHSPTAHRREINRHSGTPARRTDRRS